MKYKLLDPAVMGDNPLYTTYSPYVICTALQDEQASSSLTLTDQLWSPSCRNPIPLQLFQIYQHFHLHSEVSRVIKTNNPIYPLYSNKQEGTTQATSNQIPPKDPWKHTEPKELTTLVFIDDKNYVHYHTIEERRSDSLDI